MHFFGEHHWYWMSRHFYVAQPPMPFMMMALLATGDPFPCLFASARQWRSVFFNQSQLTHPLFAMAWYSPCCRNSHSKNPSQFTQAKLLPWSNAFNAFDDKLAIKDVDAANKAITLFHQIMSHCSHHWWQSTRSVLMHISAIWHNHRQLTVS